MLIGKGGQALFSGLGSTPKQSIIAGSSKVYAFSMEVGMVDETMYGAYEVAPIRTFTNKVAPFLFRTKFNNGGYTTIFSSDKNGSFGSGAAVTAVNTVEKLTIIMDMSHLTDEELSDTTADVAKFYLVNEAGFVILAKEINIGTLANFTWSAFAQLRMDGDGRILLGDIAEQMYNNYVVSADGSLFLEYTPGEVTPLPIPENTESYEFLGWYADAEFTQPIKEIPANATGAVKVYAKANKILVNIDYDFDTTGVLSYAGYCGGEFAEHIDANEDGKCDTCTFAVKSCGANATDHTDAVKMAADTLCDVCGKAEAECTAHEFADASTDTLCDVCGKATGECIAEHTFADENADEACDICGKATGACIAAHEFADVATDSLCDVCGKAEAECTAHTFADATTAGADNVCDVCGRKYKNATVYVDKEAMGPFDWTAGGNFTAGYAKAVANEDGSSYLQLAIDGDGPAFTTTYDKSVSTVLAGEPKKILTYSFELMAEEGQQVIDFTPRLRISSPVSLYLFNVNKEGVVSGNGINLATLSTTEMTKIDVVLDFDAKELRYYVNGVAVEETYKLTNEAADEYTEFKDKGTGVLQCRAGGAGVLNIGSVKISVGDIA